MWRDRTECGGLLTLSCSSADISLIFGLPSALSSNRMPSSGMSLSLTLHVHCVSARIANLICMLRESAGGAEWNTTCKGGVLSTAHLQEAHNDSWGQWPGRAGTCQLLA